MVQQWIKFTMAAEKLNLIYLKSREFSSKMKFFAFAFDFKDIKKWK